MSETIAPHDSLEELGNVQDLACIDQLWGHYDPRSESLEIEELKVWEEDGITLKVLRYHVAVLKGEKIKMAAVYASPNHGHPSPGLVHLHGGGQYADHRACLAYAKRGYATISLAWAGRLAAPDYQVTPDVVRLFWEEKKDHPDYKVTTDWGSLEGYHSPRRFTERDAPHGSEPEWGLDTTPSPRNYSWFLWTLGARRALTFLEQQSEVNSDRLGVFGHSMGGKISVMTAGSDHRVKAVAPSCGGISYREQTDRIQEMGQSDPPYLKNITCPIIFLSPANDFHGKVQHLNLAQQEIASQESRISCDPHLNHRTLPDHAVTGLLWFEEHLKEAFNMPQTPEVSIKLQGQIAMPAVEIIPDLSCVVQSVDIYYSRQCDPTLSFWHHVKANRKERSWKAQLPSVDSREALHVYANVTYKLPIAISGVSYYYESYETTCFTISSPLLSYSSQQLKQAGLQCTTPQQNIIESFDEGWEDQWYCYNHHRTWPWRTQKLMDPIWSPPLHAMLALDIKSNNTHQMVIKLDEYYTNIIMEGDGEWETFWLFPEYFKKTTDDTVMQNWRAFQELVIGPMEMLDSEVPEIDLGSGEMPTFRNLRWVDLAADRCGRLRV
jgi:dienelactone hydrolase